MQITIQGLRFSPNHLGAGGSENSGVGFAPPTPFGVAMARVET